MVHEVFRADVKSRAPGSLVEVLDLCRTLDFVSRLRENLGFFLGVYFSYMYVSLSLPFENEEKEFDL